MRVTPTGSIPLDPGRRASGSGPRCQRNTSRVAGHRAVSTDALLSADLSSTVNTTVIWWWARCLHFYFKTQIFQISKLKLIQTTLIVINIVYQVVHSEWNSQWLPYLKCLGKIAALLLLLRHGRGGVDHRRLYTDVVRHGHLSKRSYRRNDNAGRGMKWDRSLRT